MAIAWTRSVWIIPILTVYIPGCNGFLTAKPEDARRSVGQSVTFTCNSSWIEPISWKFICDEGCSGSPGEDIGTTGAVTLTASHVHLVGQLGAGSPDGYRSSLTVNDITKRHAGTYECQDGTGSRGYAWLTVTSSPDVVCLTVSPRDQVVLSGENVVFPASSPSSRLHHYFQSPGTPRSERVELYDGEEMNDCAVDDRFQVIGVGDQGHADLVLRSVQPRDAGLYTVKDVMETSFEVQANLVVFDRQPECKQIWNISADTVNLKCHAVFTGELKPRVTFIGQDVTDKCLQMTSSGGTILCSLSVYISDLNSDEDTVLPQHFEINFPLSRCGEPAGNWTWKSFISSDDIATLSTRIILCRWKLAFLAVTAILVILSIACCVLNYYIRKRLRHPCADQGIKRKETGNQIVGSDIQSLNKSSPDHPLVGINNRKAGKLWTYVKFMASIVSVSMYKTSMRDASLESA